jgi:transcriptional regulator with XRE-family HTH domain
MAAEIYERIGAVIRDRREALGISQAKLAERAGLVRTSVTMIERGSQSLLVHQLLGLAVALRTTPAEILSAVSAPQGAPQESHSSEVEQLLSGLDRAVHRITR